jgi:hypothetical protein
MSLTAAIMKASGIQDSETVEAHSVSIYIYIYTYIYTHIYIYIYIHIHVPCIILRPGNTGFREHLVCMRKYMHVYIHAHKYVPQRWLKQKVGSCKHLKVFANTHTHTYTHT